MGMGMGGMAYGAPMNAGMGGMMGFNGMAGMGGQQTPGAFQAPSPMASNGMGMSLPTTPNSHPPRGGTVSPSSGAPLGSIRLGTPQLPSYPQQPAQSPSYCAQPQQQHYQQSMQPMQPQQYQANRDVPEQAGAAQAWGQMNQSYRVRVLVIWFL